MLHFEVGDAFLEKYELTEPERPYVLAMADLFIDAFNLMGLSGYAIGDRDIVLGLPALRKLAGRAKFPFLCANLVEADTKKAVFTPSVVMDAGGTKVGVVAVVTTVFYQKDELLGPQKLEIADPVEAVASEAAALEGKADVIVLLGHLNDGEIAEVTRRSPQVQLVLAGQSYSYKESLDAAGTALVANGYYKGKNLSVLGLGRVVRGKPFTDRGSQGGLEARKGTLERQIAAREQSLEAARGNPARQGSVELLERSLTQQRKELEDVVGLLRTAQKPDPEAPWVSFAMEAMDDRVADHVQVAAMVKAFQEQHPKPAPAPRAIPPAALRQGSNVMQRMPIQTGRRPARPAPRKQP